MPFVEIIPTKGAVTTGTGVRMTHSLRNGLSITIAGKALAALGVDGQDAKFRILLDASIGVRQIRIVHAADGRYTWRQTRVADNPFRTIRVGRDDRFGVSEFQRLDCMWEACDDLPGIDIDLPREMFDARAVEQVTKAATVPSSSNGSGRLTTVSLPKVGGAR